MANYFEDNAFFSEPHFEKPFYQENAFFQGAYFGTAFNPPAPPLRKVTKPRKKKVVKDVTDSRDK